MSSRQNGAGNTAQAFNLSDNPLVNPPKHPHGAPALDLIQDEHFEPAIRWALDKAKADIQAIVDNPDAPTFENTIEALEFSGADLSRITLAFYNLELIDRSEAKEKISDTIIADEVTPFHSSISFNADLWDRVKAVYDTADRSALSREQLVLLEETYLDFVSNGANLNEADQQELLEIDTALQKKTSLFSQNVQKSQDSYKKIITDEDDLAGLPDQVKSILAAQAKNGDLPEGQWLIKLTPVVGQILQYSENRDLREELYKAWGTIGNEAPHDNKPVVLDIIKLRQRRAELLGFDHHGDKRTARFMAGDAQTVLDFLEANRQSYYDKAREDFDNLQNYALSSGEIWTFEPWDSAHYSYRLKKEKYDLDPKELQQYFKLENVVEGLFQHAEKLFDIEVKDASGQYPVASDAMKPYEVYDKKSGELVGLFYTDYYQRDGKKPGAWEYKFRGRGELNGEDQIPLVINCCNYPQSTEDTPTLLTFGEVETLFHEFGHGMHDLLAKGKYESLTGTSVKWDFVEFPSQIQENWANEPDVLKTFARHHETGDVIPAELLDRKKAASQYGAASAGLGQTQYALLDMLIHTRDAATITDLVEFEKEVAAKTSFFPHSGQSKLASFLHLFGDADGYSSAYYSYKWAEVLDADGYTPFQDGDLYDPDKAAALKVIYESGGVVPPDELMQTYLGREPDNEALLRREGILDKDSGKPDNNHDNDGDNNGPDNGNRYDRGYKPTPPTFFP